MSKQLDAEKLVAHIKRMAEGAAPKGSVKYYASLYGRIEDGLFDSEPEGLQSVEFAEACMTLSVGDALVCVGNGYKYKVTSFVSYKKELRRVVVRRFTDGSHVELNPKMLSLDLRVGAWEIVDLEDEPTHMRFRG